MSDIDGVIAEIESIREQGGVVDDLTLESLLRQVETRSQLDRIFAPIPDADQVVARTHAFLSGRLGTNAAQPAAMASAATNHLRELRLLLDRLDETDEAKQLVDAVLGLPVEITPDPSPDALQLTGVGPEVGTAVAPSDRLTQADLETVAGLNDWSVRDAIFAGTAQVSEAVEIVLGALPEYPQLGCYLVNPAIADPFDFGHFYLLWEAGATLWIAPDAIQVCTNSAPRWTFESYETGESGTGTDIDTDAWLSRVGPGGAKALSRLQEVRSTGGIKLDLEKLGLESMPPGTAGVDSIRTVTAWKNRFTEFPSELLQMPQLENVTLDENALQHLPVDLAESLPNLKRLNVRENSLTTLPPGITALASLERLDVSQNQLTALPDDLGALSSLKMLILNENSLTTLPPSVSQLQKLEFLDLKGNPLESLPPEFLLLDLAEDARISLRNTQLPADLQRASSMTKVRAAWPSDWPQPS